MSSAPSLKKTGLVRWAWLLSVWAVASAVFAQATVDEQAFRALPEAERYQFVQAFPFEKLDSAALANLLPRLFQIARETGDQHTALALQFHQIRGRETLKFTPAVRDSLYKRMKTEAVEGGFDIEAAVARHFILLENFQQNRVPPGQSYAEVLQELAQWKAVGFEKFRDYGIARLLFQDATYLYQLEDYENALPALLAAQGFFEADEKWAVYNFIHVANHTYSIYQRQKDYPNGIEQAKKLLDFLRNYQPVDTTEQNLCRIWQGIASIDMAAMLVAEKKFGEAETWANAGYQFVKTSDRSGFDAEAEYDALQILVPTKIELGKLDEAARLLNRMNAIRRAFPKTPYFYFKPLGFFESSAKFQEKKGDLAAAMRSLQRAKPLRDSLDRRNDVRKLNQIKQRLEAEKYAKQIRLIEHEKAVERWQKNAAYAALAFVLLLAFGIFRRLQKRRWQAQLELETAKTELERFTAGFREKSELAENLRLDMEKLAHAGERSETLEKLTHSTILTEEDWQRFRTLFEKVHPQFIAEQKAHFPDLTPAETRLVVLEKLDLSTLEMANILGVSPNTVNQTRSRLRRKTGHLP